MSDNDDKKTGAEKILEMLREAGVSTESLEEKKHAFWDTQVRHEIHSNIDMVDLLHVVDSHSSFPTGTAHASCGAIAATRRTDCPQQET
jgi:hypothetical protein